MVFGRSKHLQRLLLLQPAGLQLQKTEARGTLTCLRGRAAAAASLACAPAGGARRRPTLSWRALPELNLSWKRSASA